jgi:fructose-1,6-bisphosphatase/inositol monophosphatase family enzyme
MVHGVVLEVGDEAGHIDDGHVDKPATSRQYGGPAVTDSELVALLDTAAAAVATALGGVADWGLAGTLPGQHHSDLAADDAAIAVLSAGGVGVLSEESGLHDADRDIVVVLDPLDGSTNASLGIPWYAVSLCAVDAQGPRAALVVNLATGERFEAVRGQGARRDGLPIQPSDAARLGASVVGLSGYPPRKLGWKQYRALGASALDLCAVACGRLDAFVDCSRDAHGPWDYLGGMLVCLEAGASVQDAFDRDLVICEHAARRTPVAAASQVLLGELVAARRSFD